METSKTVPGPEHPDALTSMAHLASTYQNLGRWTEAEKLEVQVMETRKTVLGPEHPDTLYVAFISYLQALHRNDEALSVLQSCVQLQNQRLGPTHPYTVAATAVPGSGG